MQDPGASWMLYGVLITPIPLFTAGFLAPLFGHANDLTLCDWMTAPPALAFANVTLPTSGHGVPSVMFRRIIAPKSQALLLQLPSKALKPPGKS